MNKNKKIKSKGMTYKAGGVIFKNCPTCKTKAACKKAGRCLKKT